jgi:uncharacterized membrane protein
LHFPHSRLHQLLWWDINHLIKFLNLIRLELGFFKERRRINLLHSLLDFFGKAICHQIEDRSLVVAGEALAVCARDTGIYIGIFSTLIYLHIFKRNKRITIPSIRISLLLLLFLVPLIVDGVGSYTHLFATNNLRRLITGITFGLVLPYFLYPLLTAQTSEQNSEPVITGHKDVYIPLILSSILGGVFYIGSFPHLLLDSFIIISVIAWFSICASFLFVAIKKMYIKWLFSISFSFVFLTALSTLHKVLIG